MTTNVSPLSEDKLSQKRTQRNNENNKDLALNSEESEKNGNEVHAWFIETKGLKVVGCWKIIKSSLNLFRL